MKKLLTTTLVMTLSAGVLLGLSQEAKAWTEGSEDPLTDNTQIIKDTDTGNMELEGWFGTFNPGEEPDPTKPQPEENAKEWVDVTMPKKLLFGSLATDGNKVYSPNYTITNNSIKTIKVSALKMTEKESSIDNLSLNMIVAKGDDSGVNTINLVENTTLLNEKTEMSTLPSKKEVSFDLSGLYNGAYPSISEGALTPNYNLTLAFDVLN